MVLRKNYYVKMQTASHGCHRHCPTTSGRQESLPSDGLIPAYLDKSDVRELTDTLGAPPQRAPIEDRYLEDVEYGAPVGHLHKLFYLKEAQIEFLRQHPRRHGHTTGRGDSPVQLAPNGVLVFDAAIPEDTNTPTVQVTLPQGIYVIRPLPTGKSSTGPDAVASATGDSTTALAAGFTDNGLWLGSSQGTGNYQDQTSENLCFGGSASYHPNRYMPAKETGGFAVRAIPVSAAGESPVPDYCGVSPFPGKGLDFLWSGAAQWLVITIDASSVALVNVWSGKLLVEALSAGGYASRGLSCNTTKGGSPVPDMSVPPSTSISSASPTSLLEKAKAAGASLTVDEAKSAALSHVGEVLSVAVAEDVALQSTQGYCPYCPSQLGYQRQPTFAGSGGAYCSRYNTVLVPRDSDLLQNDSHIQDNSGVWIVGRNTTFPDWTEADKTAKPEEWAAAQDAIWLKNAKSGNYLGIWGSDVRYQLATTYSGKAAHGPCLQFTFSPVADFDVASGYTNLEGVPLPKWAVAYYALVTAGGQYPQTTSYTSDIPGVAESMQQASSALFDLRASAAHLWSQAPGDATKEQADTELRFGIVKMRNIAGTDGLLLGLYLSFLVTETTSIWATSEDDWEASASWVEDRYKAIVYQDQLPVQAPEGRLGENIVTLASCTEVARVAAGTSTDSFFSVAAPDFGVLFRPKDLAGLALGIAADGSLEFTAAPPVPPVWRVVAQGGTAQKSGLGGFHIVTTASSGDTIGIAMPEAHQLEILGVLSNEASVSMIKNVPGPPAGAGTPATTTSDASQFGIFFFTSDGFLMLSLSSPVSSAPGVVPSIFLSGLSDPNAGSKVGFVVSAPEYGKPFIGPQIWGVTIAGYDPQYTLAGHIVAAAPYNPTLGTPIPLGTSALAPGVRSLLGGRSVLPGVLKGAWRIEAGCPRAVALAWQDPYPVAQVSAMVTPQAAATITVTGYRTTSTGQEVTISGATVNWISESETAPDARFNLYDGFSTQTYPQVDTLILEITCASGSVELYDLEVLCGEGAVAGTMYLPRITPADVTDPPPNPGAIATTTAPDVIPSHPELRRRLGGKKNSIVPEKGSGSNGLTGAGASAAGTNTVGGNGGDATAEEAAEVGRAAMTAFSLLTALMAGVFDTHINAAGGAGFIPPSVPAGQANVLGGNLANRFSWVCFMAVFSQMMVLMYEQVKEAYEQLCEYREADALSNPSPSRLSALWAWINPFSTQSRSASQDVVLLPPVFSGQPSPPVPSTREFVMSEERRQTSQVLGASVLRWRRLQAYFSVMMRGAMAQAASSGVDRPNGPTERDVSSARFYLHAEMQHNQPITAGAPSLAPTSTSPGLLFNDGSRVDMVFVRQEYDQGNPSKGIAGRLTPAATPNTQTIAQLLVGDSTTPMIAFGDLTAQGMAHLAQFLFWGTNLQRQAASAPEGSVLRSAAGIISRFGTPAQPPPSAFFRNADGSTQQSFFPVWFQSYFAAAYGRVRGILMSSVDVGPRRVFVRDSDHRDCIGPNRDRNYRKAALIKSTIPSARIVRGVVRPMFRPSGLSRMRFSDVSLATYLPLYPTGGRTDARRIGGRQQPLSTTPDLNGAISLFENTTSSPDILLLFITVIFIIGRRYMVSEDTGDGGGGSDLVSEAKNELGGLGL